jgi:gas vesicle protein
MHPAHNSEVMGRNMTKEFLLGFAVGAGLGMLIAPDAGENTRKELKDRSERVFGGNAAESGPMGRVSAEAGAPEASNAAVAPQNQSIEYGQDQSVAEVLNHARKSELTSVEGIGDVTAKRIIRHRPYSNAEEAVREEVIPESTLEKVKEQLVEGKADEETAA